MIDVAVSLPGEVKEVKEIKEQEEDPWAILDIPDDGNVKWAGIRSTFTFSIPFHLVMIPIFSWNDIIQIFPWIQNVISD